MRPYFSSSQITISLSDIINLMKHIFMIFLLLAASSSFASELIRDGKDLIFKWDNPKGKEVTLEVKFNSPQSSGNSYKTTENSYRLTLKKLPKKVYWRVSSDRSKIFQSAQLDNRYVIRVGATYDKMDYSLDSSTLNKSVSGSGAGMYATGEFFPDFLKGNKSIRLGYSSTVAKNGSDELKRSEFDVEFGFLLKKTQDHHHLYLGYYRYQLDYSLSNAEANYSINFFSARYLFKKHLSEKMDFELNTLVRLPFPLMMKPSFNIRPTLVYKFNERYAMEGFMAVDQLKARAYEDTLNEHVDLSTFSYSIGLGLVVGI